MRTCAGMTVIASVPQLPQAGGARLEMRATINGMLYPIRTQSEANHAMVVVATLRRLTVVDVELRHMTVVDVELRHMTVVMDVLANEHERIVANILDMATVGQHTGGLLHTNALRP